MSGDALEDDFVMEDIQEMETEINPVSVEADDEIPVPIERADKRKRTESDVNPKKKVFQPL